MLVIVTGVSLLVQVYSLGYMKGDPGFGRFFAYLSLFSFSMLALVLADNFILLYMAWELVGLCSYLLIGFWYQKPEAAARREEGVRRDPRRRPGLPHRHPGAQPPRRVPSTSGRSRGSSAAGASPPGR